MVCLDIAEISIQCIHCSVTLFPNGLTIGTKVGIQWCWDSITVSLIVLIWVLHLWCQFLAFLHQVLHSHFYLPHTGVACQAGIPGIGIHHWLDLLAAHQLHLLPATTAVQVIAHRSWENIQGMQIHKLKTQWNRIFGYLRHWESMTQKRLQRVPYGLRWVLGLVRTSPSSKVVYLKLSNPNQTPLPIHQILIRFYKQIQQLFLAPNLSGKVLNNCGVLKCRNYLYVLVVIKSTKETCVVLWSAQGMLSFLCMLWLHHELILF